MKQKSTRVKNTFETLTRRQRAVTPEEKERTIRAAHMFRPDNPFFQVILRPSYVYRGFLLVSWTGLFKIIPNSFVKNVYKLLMVFFYSTSHPVLRGPF